MSTPTWLIGESTDPGRAIREGFPYEAVRTLQERLQITDETLSQLLAISARTLRRRAHDEARLSRVESDQLYMLAQVYELAVEVIGSEERTPLLSVPSVILPRARNYLFNPLHRRAGEVVVGDPEPFQWDPRLLRGPL